MRDGRLICRVIIYSGKCFLIEETPDTTDILIA